MNLRRAGIKGAVQFFLILSGICTYDRLIGNTGEIINMIGISLAVALITFCLTFFKELETQMTEKEIERARKEGRRSSGKKCSGGDNPRKKGKVMNKLASIEDYIPPY